MLSEIVELYEYNRWANRRILAAAADLNAEQYTRELKSSFPSVHATLAHMVGADWIWQQRWQGTSPAGPPGWDLTTLDAIRTKWQDVEREQMAFLETMTPESLVGVLSYRTMKDEPFNTPLWQVLRHVVNHATYHRGQVTTMLRQLDAHTVSTDLIVFYRER